MATRTAQQKTSTNEAYCPHCFLLVEQEVGEDWPQSAVRCPHCRLLIGPGRGRPTPEANPGARGSAAGVFAHQAKREDDEDGASKDEVRDAIRKVAEELGSRPERLLMVDYQQRVSGDEAMPSLSEVFSAFGSWKRARREAAV
jgi:HNH endonuclease